MEQYSSPDTYLILHGRHDRSCRRRSSNDHHGRNTRPWQYLGHLARWADNVTIDGLNSGGNALTITTVITANTIFFTNDATHDVVRNCTIADNNGSGAYGIVEIGGPLSVGNSDITIESNNIGSTGATLAWRAIHSGGTSALPNRNIRILNNNIYDFSDFGIMLPEG